MAMELCTQLKETCLNELKNKTVEQNFYLQNILEFSNDLIVILNEKKQILAYSKEFQNMFLNQDISGENFFNIMEKIVQMPNDFFKEKSYFLKVKEENPTKILKADITKLNHNTQNRYIIILKDITQKEEIQAQRENFIATLTHDLKTPVRANILSLELLLKGHFGELSTKQNEIIQEILNSNKFMMNILDTLLAKCKYENNNVEIHKNSFKLNEFVTSTTKELNALFEERHINYKLHCLPNDIDIIGDKIELKRALSNLICNAIKFNRNNGYVYISTALENNIAEIIVEDTGIGMSQDKIEHIFDKYVSYAKRFRQLGTGLGLYVAQKIVEAHDGKINVSSIPQKGSIFSIELPRN